MPSVGVRLLLRLQQLLVVVGQHFVDGIVDVASGDVVAVADCVPERPLVARVVVVVRAAAFYSVAAVVADTFRKVGGVFKDVGKEGEKGQEVGKEGQTGTGLICAVAFFTVRAG